MLNMSFEVIAVLGLLTALGALLLAHAVNGRLRARLEAQQQSIDSLQETVATLCTGAVNLGEHLAHLEQATQRLGRRQDEMESRGSAGNDNYRHAVRLMDKGVELEEVMEDCGLARGEAELLALAQRLEKAS